METIGLVKLTQRRPATESGRAGRSGPRPGRGRGIRFLAGALLCAVVLSACGGNHRDQPRYDPLQESEFFEDGSSARQIIADTVPRGKLQEDTNLYTGRSGEQMATEYPFQVTKEVLERGRERYTIHCVPCHSPIGDGKGMIVRRGFSPPPSFHLPRLKQAPPGHYYDVITRGYGAMSSYSDQVDPRDRWAIAAYIRALQLSQDASVEDVPATERPQLDATPAAEGEAGEEGE